VYGIFAERTDRYLASFADPDGISISVPVEAWSGGGLAKIERDSPEERLQKVKRDVSDGTLSDRNFSGHLNSETSRNVYCMETIALTDELNHRTVPRIS
jgi:hypothetical protein